MVGKLSGKWYRVMVLAAMVVAMVALAAPPAWAETLTVNTTADHNDGTCNPRPFNCTLREAVQISNVNGVSDTIGFASDVRGTITLGLPLTIANDSSNPVTINGPGAGALAVSGNDASRVFTINSGADATINGLTIRNGRDTTLDGDDDGGGGIYNLGTFTLNRSTVSDNDGALGGGIANVGSGYMEVYRSTISGNWGGFSGGGIYNTATLMLKDSTVSSNDSGTWGGGIYSETGIDEVANINNSTISGNRASTDSNFRAGNGGGIDAQGQTGIYHSTITANDIVHSGQSGNGVASEQGPAGTATYVTSTIISANADNSDVALDNGSTNSFSSSSNGYNLIGGGYTSPFDSPGDQTGITNPYLGPLANNGGPTKTHAVLKVSRALNAIPKNAAGCGTQITKDQRGIKRPQDKKCDIGAYEKKVRSR